MQSTFSAFSRLRIVALLAMASLLSGCGINNIPQYDEQVKAAWAQVENQYQRRADLIPNLVETVKGYAKQEQDTLTKVIEARAKATSIQIDAKTLDDPAKLQQYDQAQQQLSGALSRLMVVSGAIRTSSRTRTSWPCNPSSRAPRTASPWPVVISSPPSRSTTPRSVPSPASCGR